MIRHNSDKSMEYIGCYEDMNDDRLFVGANWTFWLGVTLELCQRFCIFNSTSTYFGAQFGSECFCGDDLSKYSSFPPDSSNCNMTCKGNPLQICGGLNRISVYSVCPKGHYGTDCSRRCYCKNETTPCKRTDGLCPPGGCQTGWQESSCSLDLDECASNRTNDCQQTCQNRVGSYTCSCQDGYDLIGTTNCQDVDECASISTNNCNQTSETCNNRAGSYSCTCGKGYELLGNAGCQAIRVVTSETWKWIAIFAITALCVTLSVVATVLLCRRYGSYCKTRSANDDTQIGRDSGEKFRETVSKLTRGGWKNVHISDDATPVTNTTENDVMRTVDDVTIHTYENFARAEKDSTGCTSLGIDDRPTFNKIRPAPKTELKQFQNKTLKSDELISSPPEKSLNTSKESVTTHLTESRDTGVQVVVSKMDTRTSISSIPIRKSVKIDQQKDEDKNLSVADDLYEQLKTGAEHNDHGDKHTEQVYTALKTSASGHKH